MEILTFCICHLRNIHFDEEYSWAPFSVVFVTHIYKASWIVCSVSILVFIGDNKVLWTTYKQVILLKQR